jgi:hypothetical protein
MAPSWILAAIFDMRSEPSGVALISCVFHQVNKRAKTPSAGIIKSRVSRFILLGCTIFYKEIDHK